MSKRILPGQTIGIIGGGHTARMIACAAKKLGFVTGVLTDSEKSPAAQVADWSIIGSPFEQRSLMDLAEKSDVLTYESERMDIDQLLSLQPYMEIPQLSDLLLVTQDRLIEKVFLESLNVNVSPYSTITDLEDIREATKSIGFPCLLKPVRVEPVQTPHLFLYSEEDFEKAEEMLQTGTCMLEAWIPFEKELAVTVAAGTGSDQIVFPVTETIYQNGLLRATLTPARIDTEVTAIINQMAQDIAIAVQLIGLLTVELFVTAAGAVYVKKLVMRPHHSCNYSLEACSLSQYEALVRTICGLPLPRVKLWEPCASFPIYAEKADAFIEKIYSQPDWLFHFYGKAKTRSDRKMGHVTILGEQMEQAQKELDFFN